MMTSHLYRRLSVAAAVALSLLFGSCFDDNIPPYSGSTGMSGRPLSPSTSEEFAEAVQGVWTFGAGSPYGSLSLGDDMIYVLSRKANAGQAGNYVTAGGYALSDDLRTVMLDGFGLFKIGAVTTEQMKASIEEGTSRHDVRMFRQELSPEGGFLGLKVASAAFYDEEDGAAVAKQIFVYDDRGRLSSLTEMDFGSGLEARLDFGMADSANLVVSGDIIERDGSGAHKVAVSASVRLDASGLAERANWSIGAETGSSRYIYTEQGFLNTAALLDTDGSFASGMAALYAADGVAQAFANDKNGNAAYTYTYDTGHPDEGNYLTSMCELFSTGATDRWLSIGGWLGRGSRRPLLRTDRSTADGKSYTRYEYTYPTTGNTNYAETVVITTGSTGGQESSGGIVRPFYYAEGREDAVERVPRTESELLGELVGAWDFPGASDYMSLELGDDMGYSLTADAEEGEGDNGQAVPRIWSGTYSVADDLQFIVLDGFGSIRVDRIAADGVRLTLMPDEGVGARKESVTATVPKPEEPGA